MTAVAPKRQRIRKQGVNISKRGMSIQYYISSRDNKNCKVLLPVCRKTFLDILRIKPYRLQLLCRRDLAGDSSPKER